MLKDKLERLKHNLDNGIEMIKHLATKCNIKVDEFEHKNKLPIPQIKNSLENNHTQEYNILNNRIDQTIDQFAQLKDLIKEISQTLNKTNNIDNAIETDNSQDINNASIQNHNQ